MVFPLVIPATPSKLGGGMLVDVAFDLLMSKSRGATLKVKPPALLEGPHEHAGPLPGILGVQQGS
jgi:hypothetical protein